LAQAIRLRYANGENPRRMAIELGMHYTSIYDVLKRHTWRHV
jgi:hypothetical protein